MRRFHPLTWVYFWSVLSVMDATFFVYDVTSGREGWAVVDVAAAVFTVVLAQRAWERYKREK